MNDIINIYVPLQSDDRLERVEHALHHIICLEHEILDALVNGDGDLEKVKKVTARLKVSEDALSKAIKKQPKP